MGIDIGELTNVITAIFPSHLAQVSIIIDAKILEWTEMATIDGLWQADLCCDDTTKISENITAIMALWRCGQSQQNVRIKGGEQTAITGRRNMVNLIDDDVIEII
ncbi:hypothetical protein D3C86_1889400 [compost metagenome]